MNYDTSWTVFRKCVIIRLLFGDEMRLQSACIYKLKCETSIFHFAGLIESKMQLSACEGGGGYVWNCAECSYSSKRRNVSFLLTTLRAHENCYSYLLHGPREI